MTRLKLVHKSDITHDELVERGERWLKSQGCGVVFNDLFRACSGTGEMPDAIGFRSGCSILIECKATRSDFLKDKRKRFRKNPELGMGDHRFYMCAPNVIHPSDIPDGWGLLWVTAKTVKKVCNIPTNTGWDNKPFTGNKQAELNYMYSALRRVSIRGHFDCIYDKIEIDNNNLRIVT
jgi:hypothetical protein